MTALEHTENSTLTRTSFLKVAGGAALIVGVGAPTLGLAPGAKGADAGPFPDVDPRRLDSWIAVHPDNTVTFFSGKNDLGQGLADLDQRESDVLRGPHERQPPQHAARVPAGAARSALGRDEALLLVVAQR